MTSMLNKWNYDPQGEVCYGQEIVYQKARDFLGDSVEDWGCGTCWAKKYFKNYKGIDGSQHPNVDVIADLTTYTSTVDNILLRQVLEHNYDWRKIIENAKASFKKKLCITLHTPIVDKTHVIVVEQNVVPDIAFCLEDITDYFKDCKITKEEVPTGRFEYGIETILCIEK